MQGQRSVVSSLPDSINIDCGSLPNGVDVDEQILWNNLRNPADTYTGNVGQEGQNPRRWNFGDLSSTNLENQVNHDEQMTQSGWSPSINAAPGASSRLEERRYEPTNPVSQTGMDLNLSSNQFVSGPTFVCSSDSGLAFHNQNMNEGQCRRSGNNMDYPSSSKSVGFESKPSGSSSSDPFASSSGSGGFLLEEDDGRPGCSMDGRRLSCKRKTLEGNVGQLSSSEGFLQRIGGGMWPTVPPQHNAGSNVHVSAAPESSSSGFPPLQVNPRLGLDLSGGISADSFRAMNPHGGPDGSRRIYNFRTNLSDQQDSTPCNPFLPVPAAVGRHPDIPLVHQPFRTVNPPLDLMSPIPPNNSVRQNQSVILRVPTLRRNGQSLRWNGGPNFRPGSSSSSAMSGERDNVVPEDLNPRNASRSIADHIMFVPPGEGRSSTQNVTNWGMSSGNVGISRNVASTSHMGSSLSSQNSSGPSWVSHRHPPAQYSRRLSEYVRRSLISTVASENASQIGNNNQHHSGLSSSQESIHPSGAGNAMHSQPRSSSVAWLERHSDGVVGFPYSLRALAAAGEGRSRLVSEIRSVLDIMRRGEGLRFEDVMVLDQSVFYGMADIHDQHRDMRLDVDNMSYEELLALEERIGNVCTGLSEETILKRMKQRKFIHTIDGDQIDAEPCCVCQETYKDGEDLGTLDCGHDFHRECIKQWLAQKNLCPICKTAALAT